MDVPDGRAGWEPPRDRRSFAVRHARADPAARNHAAMKKICCLLSFLLIGTTGGLRAAGDTAVKEMHIDPSTTRVAAIGHAKLSVETLTHEGGGFRGPYQVAVQMLPVGDEAGQLTINLSDAKLHQLTDGKGAVNFTGEAVSQDGNHSEVRGTATPASADGGAIRVHVAGKKGNLVFNTTYHLVR